MMESDQNSGSMEVKMMSQEIGQENLVGGSGTADGTNEQSTELSDNAENKKKGGWPKGKKRKKVKDENAPKQPLSGYVRFLNGRREIVRNENPHLSFADVSKLLGATWSKLPQHEKQRYLDDAVKDRERYQRELEAYHQTESYKLFRQKMEHKKCSQEMQGQAGANEMDCALGDDMPTIDIPIFTEEFLVHNKSRETELRQLRKQNTEYEEQNAILGKHIDNMKSAIGKLEVESVQQRNTNVGLQHHLENLRTTLAAHFSNIPLPGSNEVATLDNIDSYMAKLHTLMVDSPKEHERLIATVREVVTRINFEGMDKV